MQDIFLRAGARWKIVFNLKFDNNAEQKGCRATQHTQTQKKLASIFLGVGGILYVGPVQSMKKKSNLPGAWHLFWTHGAMKNIFPQD